MKNSILADALLQAVDKIGSENSISNVIKSSKQAKAIKRKAYAQSMTLSELLRVKDEYLKIVNDPITSKEKKQELLEMIRSLNYEIKIKGKVSRKPFVINESQVDVTLAKGNIDTVQFRQFKRTKPPHKVETPSSANKFLPYNHESIERDRIRKELIAIEAKAELEMMAIISRVTYTKIISADTTKKSNSLEKHEIKSPSPSPSPSAKEGVIKEFYFNKELYSVLIRTIPVSQAYKIAKSRELASQYYDGRIITGESCYFNALTYLLVMRKKNKTEALCVARNKQQSEEFLYNLITVGYRVQTRLANIIALPEKENNFKKLTSLERIDFKLISSNVERTIQIRKISDQQSFRRRVELNFKGKCAVTGQSAHTLLQACHLEDYSFSHNMNTSNGILLTSDCHRMFDSGELGINPLTLTVHFNVDCIYSRIFEGKKIGDHSVSLDKEKLLRKWELFLNKRAFSLECK
ncbi:HNH endonuclease signature motif containing protein [Enterobacter ludwigii]|uniref:HNH endonuclease signature motif containing protein n=1 Tax=Enterobacter ludwigii TaxID=299767 RepID=UPI0016395A37|nr:HNH endonuclease signature motif containing protein [Enterobacter ludwigii]MBK1520831.1 HNH endonuclease [Enterobacter ludwigii]